MAEKELRTRMVQKHDTEENWLKAVNFVPKDGEIIIYEADENNPVRLKIGDGETNVSLLPFMTDQFISYLNQQLTNEQQLQARQNIGVIGEGANGYSFYRSSVKNLIEINYEIPISKIQNHGRTLQVGDYIIISDLSSSLAVVSQIKTDSVIVGDTAVDLRGTDGIDGKDGLSIYTFHKGISDPDGYYDSADIDLPDGYIPKVRDLLIDIDTNNYDVYQITGVPSVSQIAIKSIGVQLKGPSGDSITISSLDQNLVSGGTSSVTFSDGNILSIKNGKDGRDGYSGVYVGSSEPTINSNVKIDPNGEGSVLIIPDVLQTIGDSEVDTMSQKAITELINGLGNSGGNGSGEGGRGIVSIIRTSGNGAAGSTDTYTITYTDGTTSTFTVYNGKDGTNGKSAYESAKSGGYTGTEANFNTALNNVTSFTSENWTFTLEDGSTVTKRVILG